LFLALNECLYINITHASLLKYMYYILWRKGEEYKRNLKLPLKKNDNYIKIYKKYKDAIRDSFIRLGN